MPPNAARHLTGDERDANPAYLPSSTSFSRWLSPGFGCSRCFSFSIYRTEYGRSSIGRSDTPRPDQNRQIQEDKMRNHRALFIVSNERTTRAALPSNCRSDGQLDCTAIGRSFPNDVSMRLLFAIAIASMVSIPPMHALVRWQ